MARLSSGVGLAIILAVPLGGCSSFLGIKLTRHAARDRPQVVAIEPLQTEKGRAQLAAGAPGAALEHFQRALAQGEPVAPAANGMGIGYARIGRYDLAKRFFDQAIAADPANPSYSDNLARLMRSSLLATRRDQDIAAAAIKEAQATSPITRTAQVAPGSGRMERVSRAEVRIITASPQAAPLRGSTAGIDGRFKPLVRVSFANQPHVAKQSFVRIVLPEPTAADSAAPVPAKSTAGGSK